MDSTGQQLDEAPQEAELPPPPLPPPGSFRVAHLDQARLAAQLRSLRERAQQRSSNAVQALQLSGQLLAVLCILGMGYVVWRTPDADAAVYPWVAGLTTLGLAGMALGISLTNRAPRLPGYFYRRAWQEQLHRGQCLLLADDERLRLIQQRLPVPVLGSPSTPLALPTVGQRLEFSAFHLASLRRLTQQPEQLGAGLIRRGEFTRLCAGQFDHLGIFWLGCCIGSLIFPLAWLLLAIFGLVLGPRMIEASAALSAFIDHYLEEPRIEIDGLPPPEPTRGWWAGLLAPWR